MELRVSNLDVSSGSTTLLKNISFEVNEGTWLSVLGSNGSGKTTLLRAISSLLDPARFEISGQVSLGNKLLKSMSLNEMSREVAYVSTPVDVLFPVRVLDFIFLGSGLGSGSFEHLPKIRQTETFELLKDLGCLELKDKNYQDLSQGQKQLVVLSQALIFSPSFLLLDECFLHLDLSHQAKLVAFLRSKIESGLSVISVSHDLNHSARHSDQILFLKKGEIVKQGRTTDVFQADVIENVFNLSQVSLQQGKGIVDEYF